MVIVYNEAANIKRTLERLRWVQRVVVLDSFSTDETLSIVREFPNVDILQRKFDSFAAQCNWGLSQITTEWVVSLDADYVLTDELNSEIATIRTNSTIVGFSARFRYCIQGKALRRTLLPPRTILYRRSSAIYTNEGHGHRVTIDGQVGQLTGYILHDDRKPLSRWLQSQLNYAEIEAKHLSTTPTTDLSVSDRIRKLMVPAPLMIFAYTLLGQGLILDGWRGWLYVLQRTLAEMLLSLFLVNKKIRGVSGKQPMRF